MESQQVQISAPSVQNNRCLFAPDSVVLLHKNSVFKVTNNPTEKSMVTFQPCEQGHVLDLLTGVHYLQIYGIIKLKSLLCIALVTKSQQVGIVKGKPIFKVTQVEVLPIGEHESYDPYLTSFKQSFNILDLYYSDYDLTQRLQFVYEYPAYYEHSFLCNFNHTLHHDNYPYELLTKFIFGFAATETVQQGDVTYRLTLVSRGNYNSVGRRWLRRGLNQQGHPANHYETECILEIDREEKQSIYSLVQIRGSVPLLWCQTPNFNFTAPFSVSTDQERTRQKLSRYIQQSETLQKKMLMLNLINKTGHQGSLGQLFEGYFRDLNRTNTSLCWFDYHAEYTQYKQTSYNRLIELIRHDLSEFGFLKLQKNVGDYQFQMMRSQKGVVRTNCIDCLDRSNYVQSLLGKIALLNFIDDQSNRQHLNFPLESLEFEELETVFKSLWKRNAAAIATLSTGASAMKMDFYERGRRTFFGKIRDFGVGAKRYYIGLFADFYYQNLLDLHFQKLELEGSPNIKGSWGKSLGFFASVAAVAGTSYGVYRLIKEYAKQKTDKLVLGLLGSAATVLMGGCLIKAKNESFLQRPIIRIEYI